MLRVTADSNIYISALNFGGLPEKLLDLARDGAIELAVSDAILDEVSRVLHDKFGWVEEAIAQARQQILSFAALVTARRAIDAEIDDPTDNRILECAEAGRSEYLVTGDRHLLKLGMFGGTKILRPAEFLAVHSGN